MKNTGGNMFHGGGKPPAGDTRKSAPQNTAVGGGSRPGMSKIATPTSMDGVDPKTLGRSVPGALK